jgi:hypothetical protein
MGVYFRQTRSVHTDNQLQICTSSTKWPVLNTVLSAAPRLHVTYRSFSGRIMLHRQLLLKSPGWSIISVRRAKWYNTAIYTIKPAMYRLLTHYERGGVRIIKMYRIWKQILEIWDSPLVYAMHGRLFIRSITCVVSDARSCGWLTCSGFINLKSNCFTPSEI